ncbi:heme biosynthesis HemY N-terminal domain-containing protein [Crenothrix sp.]|uniref:heme biosynthesis HemY N-terminal domain-containing protein n=1 Tax=Crenothrix sp. TaxID=3100433 RepID=UPI00374CCDCC
MKKLLYLLGPLLLAIIVVFLLNKWLGGFETPGYVLIGIGEWSMETSLVVFAISLVIGFYICYNFFRVMGWLVKMPKQLKNRGKRIKFNRSQEALIAGLVDSAEGNFEKAEKALIKHASHSGAPLLHYLTAARAAQSRGAFEKRDEYLKIASDKAPGSDLAVGLTHAELSLSGNQFDQALQTLTKLHSIDPSHASVLRLLHQTYQNLGDWENIRKLIPTLNKNKVMMEAEIKLLEAEAFSNLLKQAAERGNAQEIQTLWADIPSYIKRMHGLSAIYFAAMINAGASAKVEEELTKLLSVNWDETLLVLFGSVQSEDSAKQFAVAEKWLSLHSKDVVLLNVLGKLSIKVGEPQKAEDYLSQSIQIEPTVQAYQLLGDVLFAQNEKDKACECYKYGLELASSEIVSQIDAVS